MFAEIINATIRSIMDTDFVPIYLPSILPILQVVGYTIIALAATIPLKAILLSKYTDRQTWTDLFFADLMIVFSIIVGYLLTLDAFNTNRTVSAVWVFGRCAVPAVAVIGLWRFHYRLRHKFLKAFGVPRKWYHRL
jgi:hypothetical protein